MVVVERWTWLGERVAMGCVQGAWQQLVAEQQHIGRIIAPLLNWRGGRWVGAVRYKTVAPDINRLSILVILHQLVAAILQPGSFCTAD